jgi:hypothetical protein
MKTGTLRGIAAGHVASATSVILTGTLRGEDPVPWDAVLIALVLVMAAGAALLIVLALALRTLDARERVVFVNLAVGLCAGALATVAATPVGIAMGVVSLALALTSVAITYRGRAPR